MGKTIKQLPLEEAWDKALNGQSVYILSLEKNKPSITKIDILPIIQIVNIKHDVIFFIIEEVNDEK